jgi:hypothetical protein
MEDMQRDGHYFLEAFKDTPPDIITLRMVREIPMLKVPGDRYYGLHPWELQWLTENRNVIWEEK